MLEIKKNDVWIINYPVPYKNLNELARPFIVLKVLSKKIYGIPLTSFANKTCNSSLGDFIIDEPFLSQKSIVKPQQLIAIKKPNFIKKCGEISPQIGLKINHNIEKNFFIYLNLKNTNSILREYVVEKQNQKITLLELENQNLRREVELLKQSKEFQENEFELEME